MNTTKKVMSKRRYLHLRLRILLCLWQCFPAALSSNGNKIQLVGVGASFPAEIYDSWTAAFENDRQDFVQLDHEYYSLGSGLGKEIIMGEVEWAPVSYVGSDSILTKQEYEDNPNLQMLPILAGAVTLTYNLNVTNLNLTMDHVVGIYNGTYSTWNNPAIQASNPDVTLPAWDIKVIVRADEAGSTEIFTLALSAHSQAWAETYGNFSLGLDEDENLPVHWNPNVTRFFGRTSRGMSGLILSYRGSIGYLSTADVKVTGLSAASLISPDGVPYSLDSVDIERAMKASKEHLSHRMMVNLQQFIEPGDYPIIGYTYLIVRKYVEDCDQAVALARYIDWAQGSEFARGEAVDSLMVNIDREILDLIEDNVLKKMTCGQGNSTVWDLVQQQIHEEWLSTQIWRVPVMVTVPIVVAIVLALCAYVIFQQVKLRRALKSDKWQIPSDAIQLVWSRKMGMASNFGPGSAVSLNISTISNLSLTMSPQVWGVGEWTGKTIAIRSMVNARINLQSSEVRQTLLWMRYKVQHGNVLRVYGVTFIDNETFLVSDHCPKGTLSDVIQNDRYRIDDNIKFSLAMDVATGMAYLHGFSLIHGRLASISCFIDQRWNVRVSDWEYPRLLEVSSKSAKLSKVSPMDVKSDTEDPNILARKQFFCDPVLLKVGEGAIAKKYNDVYSFAMILVEIFTREDPYSELSGSMDPAEIIQKLTGSSPDIRPNIYGIEPPKVITIIQAAWHSTPEQRPSFSALRKALKEAKPSKRPVMDSMMEVLEGYVNTLEEKVAERTADLATANNSLQSLLHKILPPTVADSLSKGQTVEPETYENVTIFFSDIVGFTSLSAASTPMEIVTMLNDLYTTFDAIVDNHDVYKVETIGDAYMVISGLPKRNGVMHAAAIATMALDLLAAAKRFRIRHRPNQQLNLRAGVHTGSVVAGVVGLKMPRYCLFGDTVNTASRMESTSAAMKIQISEATHRLLVAIGRYKMEERGTVEMKGKGKMKTYFLEGKEGYTALSPDKDYCFTYLNEPTKDALL